MRAVIVLLATLIAIAASPVASADDNAGKLVAAAREQTMQRVTYDGSYRRIGYPGGDVPAHLGVCTDVVIRAYRAVGVDLQVLVHEDMTRHFAAYPAIWNLRRPDRNIDHRRVPNLQTFLARQGTALVVSQAPRDYRAGGSGDVEFAGQPAAHRDRVGPDGRRHRPAQDPA